MESLTDDDLEKSSSDASDDQAGNDSMMKWNLTMIMMNQINNQLKTKKLF